MRRVRFHPEAEAEMRAAAVYYESLRRGLGRRFLVAVQDAVSRLRANPDQYQVVGEDARRCLTRTFPFGVVYRTADDTIVIVAVMHLHREPGYWRHRAGPPEGR